MKINTSKVEIDFNFTESNQQLEILAKYQNKIIGSLNLNQAYDEKAVLNYIPEDDDDEDIPEAEPYINLQLIEVDENYRLNGIANLLMKYLFDNNLYELFEENNIYIRLDVHPQGLGITKNILEEFYSQYGFIKSYGNYMIKEI